MTTDVKRILEGKSEEVEQALNELVGFIDETQLLDLASQFSKTYRKLAKESREHFLVTPVTALPTGKEKGKFLSIDVGGTNLRVGFIELLGELENGTTQSDGVQNGSENGRQPLSKIKRSYEKSWPIEEHMKMDKAEDLFAWIGDCMAEVITNALEDMPQTMDSVEESPFGEELLLGITFSFPMEQTCLSEATLLPMGKGFAITSNLDLRKMLLDGYARHIIAPTSDQNGDSSNEHTKRRRLSPLPRIRLAAITNDTVATFASLAYAVKAAPNSRVAMGLIVGTGTNATVPMPLSALHPSKVNQLPHPESVSTVVINTEWTIRGTDAPLISLGLKTKWDLELDASSEAPGFQPFEYMTAGRYLGEIVRLVFVDLFERESGVGAEYLPPALKKKNALPTRFLSEVVATTEDDGVLAAELAMQYPAAMEDDEASFSFWKSDRVQLMRDIAFAVQQRSSALIAAACVGLLDGVGDISLTPSTDGVERNGMLDGELPVEELVIAYAGGTISQYPLWAETCQRWIDTLVQKGSSANARKRVVLKEALDGGIVGAGVLAGMTDDIA